ncbi:hypothetical protein J6590_079606 [Homalodisca vitripennis]|nr:hypothetical protein J6590_079606 [Homalodisca vitripennis]
MYQDSFKTGEVVWRCIDQTHAFPSCCYEGSVIINPTAIPSSDVPSTAETAGAAPTPPPLLLDSNYSNVMPLHPNFKDVSTPSKFPAKKEENRNLKLVY